MSFDSIATLSRLDSSQLNRFSARRNPVIDSLKGVANFIGKASSRTEGLQGKATIDGYNSELSSLQGKLNYREQINELITKRTAEIKSICNGKIAGIDGIEKQVYYGKAQIKAYKNMAEEPSKLEAKAYEFLQGQAGFEEGVDEAVQGNKLLTGANGGNLSVADLEKMGFQTKRQLNAALQQKFGNSVGAAQQQIGSQLTQWQQEVQGITSPIKNASNQVKDIKSQAKETKQTVSSLKNSGKPSFKINPMRCLPFWQRIEKSFDFQTSRATPEGKPAMLQLGTMAAYKHTPKLSGGLGLAASFGLGQSWSQIHFSFEGIGARSFAKWELLYGVGAYAGYERMYKQAAFTTAGVEVNTAITSSAHNTTSYSESALLGLTKSYQINSKQHGSIQVLYDFWWKEKQSNTPIILRFGTELK